jgi:hypothetical protein
MSQELVIALIAAAAVVVGALIAVLAQLASAALAQKTVREDREAVNEAEAERWREAQKASHALWLRDQRQTVIFNFSEACEQAMYRIALIHHTVPREMSSEDTDWLIKTKTAMSSDIDRLFLLGSTLSNDAAALTKATTPIMTFIEQAPGEVSDELEQMYSVLREDYHKKKGAFVRAALFELGIPNPSA